MRLQNIRLPVTYQAIFVKNVFAKTGEIFILFIKHERTNAGKEGTKEKYDFLIA